MCEQMQTMMHCTRCGNTKALLANLSDQIDGFHLHCSGCSVLTFHSQNPEVAVMIMEQDIERYTDGLMNLKNRYGIK